MSPKELAEEQSETIFENDNVKFIEILGYQAMEYYGSEYLNQSYKPNKGRGGNIFLVIDKKGDKNYQIYEPRYGQPQIEDFDGKIWDFGDVIKHHPDIALQVINLTASNTPYGILFKIKNGVEVDKWQLRDSDDCFGGLIYNQKNPTKSMIRLTFDESEFFGFFEFAEGDWDKRILEGLFGGRYGGYGLEIFDGDWVYYEWNEGYIIRNINDENEKLLEKILIQASPTILDLKDKDDEKYYSSIAEFLDDNFSREAENITDEYQEQLNEGADKKIKEYAISDIGDPFRNYGVLLKGDSYFTNYVTTTNILLSLYSITGIDKTSSIKELFEALGKDLDIHIGNYNEIGRESWDIDMEKWNDVVKTNLESILENIAENPEKYEGTRKYGEVLQTLNKMGYEIGKFYKLPYNKSDSFRIKDVNKETLRITLEHFIGNEGTVKSYSLEEFNNFLSSPELFEHLFRKLKKML
jgi:hypothetical protein